MKEFKSYRTARPLRIGNANGQIVRYMSVIGIVIMLLLMLLAAVIK